MEYKTLEQALSENLDFTLSTFHDVTALGALKKASEELHEIVCGIERGDRENTIEEYTDFVSCIFDSMYKAGFTFRDFTEALVKKTDKNKKRTWIRNADGTYSHEPNDWEREEKQSN